MRAAESVNAFRVDLISHDWGDVLQAKDVNTAYHIFRDAFLVLYNKSCPVRQSIRKNRSSEKPWLTRGILNAWKKETLLNITKKQRQRNQI